MSVLTKFIPSNDDFEMKQYPFYWITRAHNLYVQIMEKQLKKRGINMTAWQICLVLSQRGSLSMTEIADHAAARLPTITKCAYKTQEQGMLTIEQSKNDARVTMVSLSAKGIEVIDQLMKDTKRLIERAFEDIDPKDLETMNHTIEKIFNNWD